MFVRFVVGADHENAAWLTGVIAEARILDDNGHLYRHESDLLEATFAWLNQHLPCPPFTAKLRSGEWNRDAVSWFRSEAKGAGCPHLGHCRGLERTRRAGQVGLDGEAG